MHRSNYVRRRKLSMVADVTKNCLQYNHMTYGVRGALRTRMYGAFSIALGGIDYCRTTFVEQSVQ